jgi:hypothetical protein
MTDDVLLDRQSASVEKAGWLRTALGTVRQEQMTPAFIASFDSNDLDTRRVAFRRLSHSRSASAILPLAKSKDPARMTAFWISWARTQGLIK